MEAELETPLLDTHEMYENKQRSSQRVVKWFSCAIVQFVFLTLYTAAMFAFFRTSVSTQCENAMLLYSPAREAVIPEIKLIEGKLEAENVFKGPPSNATDDAWKALFQYSNIRLSAEELGRLGETSTPLQDSSGDFLGSLDVYHELHCVNYIRKYVHSDYYTLPTVVGANHVDHVDMLRQLVMCKADISVMTFSWHPHVPGPWPKFALNHECRNWDSIDRWASERAIKEDDLDIILKPVHAALD